MSNNLIKLLPDNVANQIAAGEVIQRPASVLKELLENAVDAGAKNIQIIIKDAGRSLIQVIDDGQGMSAIDAELCFVRHATSKIASAEDLFSINSKGFRGEAMASIASVAHVELKTKTEEEELGNLIFLEGGKINTKEYCQTTKGTTVSVKNLFFNIPARRKFLKSNTVEGKHINDEFTRIALIHPEISFKLFIDDQEIYNLPLSNFKQRIIGVFGKNYQERLVPVSEKTEIINISGFILKPEYAKKTRGEQYFFVNKRFIKHGYFHHAVSQAFEGLISPNSFASYFIELEVNPKDIDINIHPTKTEVKFTDERSIYAMLKATINKGLNQHSLAPTLDFDQESSFDTSTITWDKPIKTPEIKVDKTFNPFTFSENEEKERALKKKEISNDWKSGSTFKDSRKDNSSGWENLYKGIYSEEAEQQSTAYKNDSSNEDLDDNFNAVQENGFESFAEQSKLNIEEEKERFYKQLQRKYILTENKQGILIINQKRAHQRVLFEHFTNAFDQKENYVQQLLFPETIDFSAKEMILLNELLPDLKILGFDISLFGKNSIVVNGIPADLKEVNAKDLIESLIQQFTDDHSKLKLSTRELLSVKMAQKLAVKYGQVLQNEELKNLCEQLFLCNQPLTSPTGKPTLINYNFNLIDKQLS